MRFLPGCGEHRLLDWEHGNGRDRRLKLNSICELPAACAGASASQNYAPGVPAVSADPAADSRMPIIEM
jgi:hypothetical protein